MYKFALVGCGNISNRHAENIARVGNLAAVCDIVPGKADRLALKYNAKPYYSIDDLLQKETAAEIIVVCTPNGLHAEHSIKSLASGKHVLCEKPICLTTNQGCTIVNAADIHKKKIFVVKQNR